MNKLPAVRDVDAMRDEGYGEINAELEHRLERRELGPYTYRDYYALGEEGPRFQLIRGWLVREPSPFEAHQRAVGNLYLLMRQWVDAHALGKVYLAPFDTVFSPKDIVQPDILFVSSQRRDRITERSIQGAPDLVVEVLSRGTRNRDREVKLAIYADGGVREAWMIDPAVELIELHALQETGRAVRVFAGDERIASGVLGRLPFAAHRVFEP